MTGQAGGHSVNQRLLVNEVFGPTIQGEGKSAGTPAVFVRVAQCPLRCVWCDTPYSWDWSRFDRSAEVHERDVSDVWSEVRSLGGQSVRRLVLTGGEPASQLRAVEILINAASQAGWATEIETSGVRALRPVIDLLDVVTVSPKLANSGMPEAMRVRPDVLSELAVHPRVLWKFVVEDVADLAEVDALVKRFRMRNVYLMPQATTASAVLAGMRSLVGPAVERGYRVSPRLHVLLWGDVRGR